MKGLENLILSTQNSPKVHDNANIWFCFLHICQCVSWVSPNLFPHSVWSSTGVSLWSYWFVTNLLRLMESCEFIFGITSGSANSVCIWGWHKGLHLHLREFQYVSEKIIRLIKTIKHFSPTETVLKFLKVLNCRVNLHYISTVCLFCLPKGES